MAPCFAQASWFINNGTYVLRDVDLLLLKCFARKQTCEYSILNNISNTKYFVCVIYG